jgi:hypothetical protein
MSWTLSSASVSGGADDYSRRPVKQLLRFLGRLHLWLDTQPPQEEGRPPNARRREQMRKDMDWQEEAEKATRGTRESLSRWWHRQ